MSKGQRGRKPPSPMNSLKYPPEITSIPQWARYNCLTYALWAWNKYGGYIMVRRSMIGNIYELKKYHPMWWTPHFLHKTYDGRISQLAPTEEQVRKDSKNNVMVFWWRLWKIPSSEIVEGDYKCIIRKASEGML